MGKYYIKRYQDHLKELSKYSKYVFNDHLMIIMFFLFGGLMLSYMNFLEKGYQIPFLIGKGFILIIAFILVKLGKLATLLQTADSVFLLPKESQMKSYFKKATLFSLMLPILWISLSGFFLWPLVRTNHLFSSIEYILLIATVIIFKYCQLLAIALSFYFTNLKYQWQNICLVLGLLCSLVPNGVYLTVIIALINSIFLWWYYQNKTQILNFTQAIDYELRRMQRIYRFLNLFTDVPNVQMAVKRRKYLDFIMKKIPKIKANTYQMLYYSELCRGNVYGGLLIKLMLISFSIVILSNNYLFSLLITAIFLLLLLIQCLSLYQEFDYQLLTRIYPIGKDIKQKSFRKVIMGISLIMIGLNFIALLRYGLLQAIIGGFMLIIFSLMFIYLYVNRYMKKQNSY